MVPSRTRSAYIPQDTTHRRRKPGARTQGSGHSQQEPAVYEELHQRCVVMLPVEHGNRVLVECIPRNVPMILRRFSATVDYIGADYPLFYEDNQLRCRQKTRSREQWRPFRPKTSRTCPCHTPVSRLQRAQCSSRCLPLHRLLLLATVQETQKHGHPSTRRSALLVSQNASATLQLLRRTGSLEIFVWKGSRGASAVRVEDGTSSG
jgi:hypothetical protein